MYRSSRNLIYPALLLCLHIFESCKNILVSRILLSQGVDEGKTRKYESYTSLTRIIIIKGDKI